MDHTDYIEGFPKDNEIIELLPCIICNRSFRPTLLQRHSAICEKASKKRKVPFDSSKQRRQGTDMAAYLPRIKKTQDIKIEKSKTNWKAKHEELIRTVKAARGETDDDNFITTKPVDTEGCPHCARNFGPKSYDRHVEFCREKSQRKFSVPMIRQLAKERLEARTKYRAPQLKSQRTKEKYSPKTKSLSQDVSSVPIKALKNVPLKNVIKKTPATNNKLSKIPRQPSVLKTKNQTTKSLYGNRNAIYLPQKPEMEKEKIMKKSESTYILGSQNQVKQEYIKTVNNYDKKNISKPSLDLENYDSHLYIYDPFKSAEQQMKELDKIDISVKTPLNCTPTNNNECLQISPISPSVTSSNIKNSISDQFHTDTNLNNHPLHNLSYLNLCSNVNIKSAEFNNKTHSAVMHSTEFPKRSISHNFKKHIAIENMLYGDSKNDKSNHKFDLEEQELLKSDSKFVNLLKITNDDDIVSPSLNRTSALRIINGGKFNSSADSAYGSLNRKPEQMTTDNYLTVLKVAKFCYECGFRYPIADIKFCSKCGTQRIIS